MRLVVAESGADDGVLAFVAVREVGALNDTEVLRSLFQFPTYPRRVGSVPVKTKVGVFRFRFADH
jgi:hypothetical protein